MMKKPSSRGKAFAFASVLQIAILSVALVGSGIPGAAFAQTSPTAPTDPTGTTTPAASSTPSTPTQPTCPTASTTPSGSTASTTVSASTCVSATFTNGAGSGGTNSGGFTNGAGSGGTNSTGGFTNGAGSGGTNSAGGTGTSSAATSTTDTIVVHYYNLAVDQSQAGTTTQWFFWNGTGINTALSSNTFVQGPGTAPLGSGSVRLTANGGETSSIATYQYGGVKLRDISALSFKSYVDANGSSTPVAPFLAFNVDLGGMGAGTGELVYLPSHNGTVASSTWQTWDVLGNGNWAWSGFASTTSTSTPNMWPDANTTQFRSWNDLASAFPNARISSTSPLLGIGIQSPNASTTVSAAIDDFSITLATTTVSGSSTQQATATTIFDFEPNIVSGGGGGGTTNTSSSSGGGSVAGTSNPTPSTGSVLGAATSSPDTGTVAGTSTETPGVPNTGAGGTAAVNILFLLTAIGIALTSAFYLARSRTR